MAEKYRVRIVQNTIRATIPGQGPQGPQGIPGPAGGTAVTYPAGENLAAGRVVIIEGGEAFLFQPGDTTHQGRAYGITTAAANMGEDVTIQIGGEITNAAFTFGADSELWVFNNGIIVDTAPVVSVIQSAGVSAGNLTMRINFNISILTS